MMLPLRINLYGGAGCGKSTLAARLFADLKQEGVKKLELVQEWIKGWAWENRKPDDCDQVYIFAKQMRAENRLLKLGVSIITDSPLQMQLAYMSQSSNIETSYVYRNAFGAVANDFDRKYPNLLNVLLNRPSDMPYEETGRYQDRKDAEFIDTVIRNHLRTIQYIYTSVNPLSEFAYNNLFHDCLKQLTESK